MAIKNMGLPGQLWRAFKSAFNVSMKVVPRASELKDTYIEDGTLFVTASEKEFKAGMIESIVSNDVLSLEIPGVHIVKNRQFDEEMSAVPRLITGLLPLCDFLAIDRESGEYGYLVVGINASGHTIPVVAATGNLPNELAPYYREGVFNCYRYIQEQKILRAVPIKDARIAIWSDDVIRSYVLPDSEFFDDKALKSLNKISSDDKEVASENKPENKEPVSPPKDEEDGAEPASDSPSL